MVEDQKRDLIKAFVLEKAGQRLAGERELAAQFGVSRPALRAILQSLEQEGLIQRRQGSGTYALSRDASKLRRALILLDSSFKLGDDPFISRLVEALQKELQEMGAQCLIQRTAGSEEPLRHCDGIIALGAASLNTMVNSSEALPTVGLFAAQDARPGKRFSLLELDDADAGRQAAQRLLKAGVQRIYFCGRQNLSAARERLSGVEEELKGPGVPLQIFECGLNYAAGFQLGTQFSQVGTGIIAANDWLALGIHTGLQSALPNTRNQVQLVSFDGLPMTAEPQLGIASLVVPIETMAADAVAELQRLRREKVTGRAIRYSLEWR